MLPDVFSNKKKSSPKDAHNKQSSTMKMEISVRNKLEFGSTRWENEETFKLSGTYTEVQQ